jgi:hypothetical protein
MAVKFIHRWIVGVACLASCAVASGAVPEAKTAVRRPLYIRPAPRATVEAVPAVTGAGAGAGAAREIWIGLRTDGLPGDGTLASPYNGVGAGFDAKLSELQQSGVTNIAIHVQPGTYDTRGSLAYQPLSGWRILGAGMDITTLKLVNVSNAAYIAVIGNTAFERGIDVADLTVDCNYSLTNPSLSSGISLSGTHHSVRRVKAVNAYGALGVYENFTITIGNQGRASEGNLIEYCEVSAFKGSYSFCISFNGGSFAQSANASNYISGIIRGNRVLDLHFRDGPSLLQAYGMGGPRGVVMENNFAYRCDIGFNADTGYSRDFTMRGNHFYGCRKAGIVMPGQLLENITFEENFIEIDPLATSAGIAFTDNGGLSQARHLIVRNNVIRPMNGLAAFAGGLAISVLNGESVIVSGNRVHAGLRNFFSPPGIRLFDNTDFEGRPITLHPAYPADLVSLPAGERGTLLLNKGDAYVIAEAGRHPATNGLNLIAAYARARALRPHGQPLSATNRAALLLWPAKYQVADGALVLDTEYVDLVGLGAPEATRIESDGNALVQTASDVLIQNVTLHCASTVPLTFTASDKAAYFPADNLARARLRHCVLSAANNGLGMRLGVTYAGYYEHVTCGPRGWGGPGHFTGAALNCSAGDYSFGSGGMSAGFTTNCTAGTGSFGAAGGGFHGVAKNCTAGHESFGGSGWLIGCEVTGAVNATQLTTGRLTDCRIGPPPPGQSALLVGAGATLHNCTVLASPVGGGFSLDAPAPVRVKAAHCRFNRGVRNVINDIVQPFNVDDPAID